MSLRHFLSENKLSRVLQAVNKVGLYPLVSHGTLLGAIRNFSFAGRPADIDFVFLPRKKKDISCLVSSLVADGYKLRENTNKYSMGRCLKVIGRGPNVDIIIPSRSNERNDIFVFRKKNGKTYTFLEDDLRKPVVSLVYSTKVLAPRNSEYYLSAWYGPDWRHPAKIRPASNDVPFTKG
jgi:hypothetical protein